MGLPHMSSTTPHGNYIADNVEIWGTLFPAKTWFDFIA